MQFSKVILLAIASLAAAQRPNGTSICDYYTTALLKDNNATNQLTVLTLIVNTALIGNYTPDLNKGVKVDGILNPNGTYNGQSVNLVPYFSGALYSTNRGSPRAVNFLDDGGAAPLMKNMASNGNTTSNQYLLITHLYSFFGVLAGCTQVGQMGFPAYGGNTNMAEVHGYMDLSPAQLGYFIQEVGKSALSFGVTSDDAMALGSALNQHFGYKCGPVESIIPSSQRQNQSICQADSCPLAPGGSCNGITPAVAPRTVSGNMTFNPNSTTGTGTNGTGTGTSTGGSGSTSSAAATLNDVGSVTGVMGLAGLIAMLMV